jgi:DNA-binding MarR family transcriptional regulator
MSLRYVPSIHRATHRIGLSLASLGRDVAHGLTQGEAHVLAQLAAGGPATVGALHAGLAHQRSTLTSILDRLVRRGYITRTTSDRDRRTFVVATTPRGRAVAARVHRHFRDLEAALARRVTPAEARVFLKVLSAMEELAHEAGRAAPRRR